MNRSKKSLFIQTWFFCLPPFAIPSVNVNAQNERLGRSNFKYALWCTVSELKMSFIVRPQSDSLIYITHHRHSLNGVQQFFLCLCVFLLFTSFVACNFFFTSLSSEALSSECLCFFFVLYFQCCGNEDQQQLISKLNVQRSIVDKLTAARRSTEATKSDNAIKMLNRHQMRHCKKTDSVDRKAR